MKKNKWTKDRVLNIAKNQDFYVHMFSWGHSNLRKLTRRMYKDGLLIRKQNIWKSFVYRAA